MTPNNEQLEQLRALYLGTAKDIPAATLKAFEDARMIERQHSLTRPYVVAESGICDLVEYGLVTDYFDHYEKQPPAIKAVIAEWEEKVGSEFEFESQEQIEQYLSDVEAHGFTFCYDFTLEPMFLVKSPAK